MSNRKKWTPGPWAMVTNWQCPGALKGAMIYARVEPGLNPRIADVSAQSVNSQETCEANAKLFAAAPDLYDSLVLALQACYSLEEYQHNVLGDDSQYQTAKLIEQAKAALAKARGD